MTNPVEASDGNIYEESSILDWFKRGNMNSPVTHKRLENTILTENHLIRDTIFDFKE